MSSARPLVLVDADDTLWENYRFFADVIGEWAEWMEARGVPSDRAVAALESCEDRNIPQTGYGSAPFVASLRDAFRALRPEADEDEIREFAAMSDRAQSELRDHRIDLLPGVADAIAELAERVRLVLFTKGREDEQLAKFERAGIARHFESARVVPEKNVEAYSLECTARGVAPYDAWMIGNSARSDVNPARRAGLRTIHVPHPAPWHRDEEPLVAAGIPTLVARDFGDVPRLIRDAAE